METQYFFVLGFGMQSASRIQEPKSESFFIYTLYVLEMLVLSENNGIRKKNAQHHLYNDNATKINVKNHVYVSVSHIVIICDRRISQTLQNRVTFKKIGIFFSFYIFSFALLSSIHAECSLTIKMHSSENENVRMPYILSALYSFEFCNRLRIPIRIKEKNCSTKCDIKTVNVCVCECVNQKTFLL